MYIRINKKTHLFFIPHSYYFKYSFSAIGLSGEWSMIGILSVLNE